MKKTHFKKKGVPPIIMRHPTPIVPRGLVVAFAACLTFIVMYSALSSVIHTKSLYSAIDTDEKRIANAKVLAYLDSPVFSPNNLDFLTLNERDHMSDVKRVFDIVFLVDIACIGFMIAVAAVLASNKMWARLDELLGRSLQGMGWTLLSICFVFGVASLLNFDKLWLIFHAVLFPQGNWMFPYDSILITLYPASFFESVVVRWLFYLLAVGVVAIALSYIIKQMRMHEAHFGEKMKK